MCQAKATAGRRGTTSRSSRRSDVSPPAGGVGARRDARGRAARRRARPRRVRAAAGDPDHRAGDRRGQLSDRPAASVARRCVGDRRRARCVIDGELAIGGQEHFYLETQAAIAWLDESGGVAAALVDAASVRDAGDRRARARRAAQSGDGRVPAHGRRVRRQGSAGERVGRDRRARRVEDRPAGARASDARARHGAHRQAASVSGPLRGGLRRRRPHRGADGIALFSDGGWSLDLSEPIMWRVAVPLRQRLLPAGGRSHRPRLPHAQDLADGVPRLRRTAGDGGDRRDPRRRRRSGCRLPPTSSASATSTARARRRTTARRSTTPGASTRSGAS